MTNINLLFSAKILVKVGIIKAKHFLTKEVTLKLRQRWRNLKKFLENYLAIIRNKLFIISLIVIIVHS